MPAFSVSLGNVFCKVGQNDLAFGMSLEFVSRYVRARLQVSVCSGYDLCHSG